MIEAVIFDIDGTIVDSVTLHAKAWQRTFAKFGKNILLEAIRSQIGKGADQLLPVYFSKQELERFGETIETYRGELFNREYLPKVKAFPKVRELFERIKQDNKCAGRGALRFTATRLICFGAMKTRRSRNKTPQ